MSSTMMSLAPRLSSIIALIMFLVTFVFATRNVVKHRARFLGWIAVGAFFVALGSIGRVCGTHVPPERRTYWSAVAALGNTFASICVGTAWGKIYAHLVGVRLPRTTDPYKDLARPGQATFTTFCFRVSFLCNFFGFPDVFYMGMGQAIDNLSGPWIRQWAPFIMWGPAYVGLEMVARYTFITTFKPARRLTRRQRKIFLPYLWLVLIVHVLFYVQGMVKSYQNGPFGHSSIEKWLYVHARVENIWWLFWLVDFLPVAVALAPFAFTNMVRDLAEVNRED